MKDLLQPRIESLRTLPGQVRKEAFLVRELNVTLRQDLNRIANSGFWGAINTPEDLVTLADRDARIIVVGHQPLIGINAPVHAKYLAAGLERVNDQGRGLVVVNFITDVDKVGNEEGAFDVAIPGRQQEGVIVTKTFSPFGQQLPTKEQTYYGIDAPESRNTVKFLDSARDSLAGVLPNLIEEINRRTDFLKRKMLEKMQTFSNLSLSEWSTLLRHIIYEECGIRIIEIGEKDFLRTNSALVGLAHIIKNADRWFSSHRQIIDLLSNGFAEEVEHGVFPGPRREVTTDLGKVTELPVWILVGNSRVRAGLLRQQDEVSVVSLRGTGNLTDGLISFLYASIGEKFDLGDLTDLTDPETLIERIKNSGLDKRWAWDVISFTYLVRNIFKLPYISGRGGAKYDVVTENIALALEGREYGTKLVLDKSDLGKLGSEPFWVGIPEEKYPRHRSSRGIYQAVKDQIPDIQRRIRKLGIEIEAEGERQKIKLLRKEKDRLSNLLPRLKEVRSGTPSLLEIYLTGGREAVLSILTSIEKYEGWLSGKQGLKIEG